MSGDCHMLHSRENLELDNFKAKCYFISCLQISLCDFSTVFHAREIGWNSTVSAMEELKRGIVVVTLFVRLCSLICTAERIKNGFGYQISILL